MRPIDADWLLCTKFAQLRAQDETGDAYIRVNDLIAMVKQAPTVTLPVPGRDGAGVPNEPLTLEQLKEMMGEVVWTTPLNDWVKITCSGLAYFGTDIITSWKDIEAGYGVNWLAYLYKPERKEEVS